MIVVVDGNDGTGKTTLVSALRAAGFEVRDRGVPTRMTDDPSVSPQPGEAYLILDAPVPLLRERLRRAGKDLEERYHTVADLEHYRQRFLEVARALPQCVLLDASGPPEDVLVRALEALRVLC